MMMKLREMLAPWVGDREKLGSYFDLYLLALDSADGTVFFSFHQLADRWRITDGQARHWVTTALEMALLRVVDENPQGRVYSVAGVPCRYNKGTYSELFEEAWGKVYPRRAGHSKAKAWQCWNGWLKRGRSEEELLEAVKAYRAYCDYHGTEPHFVKHMSTFLSLQGEWIDADWTIEPKKKQGPPPSRLPSADEINASLRG